MRRSNVIVLDRDFEERERYGLPPLEHEDLTVRIIPAVKKEKPKNAIKEETKKISERIRQERSNLRLSDTKLAKLIGISQPTLSNIARLKTNASPETLKKLNEYFKKKDGD